MVFKFFNIALVCFILFSKNMYGQKVNVAINKPYTFSSSPNYRFSDVELSKVTLTNGVKKNKSDGGFWTRKTTAGWQYKQFVAIKVDLKKVYPISEVCFNTVKRIKSGIYFPDHIFVYLSKNETDYYFAGDMIDNYNASNDPYQVLNFEMSNIRVDARYVKLIIIPHKNYLFCDEIEVFIDKDMLDLQKVTYDVTEEKMNEKTNYALVRQKAESIFKQTRNRLSLKTNGEIAESVNSQERLDEMLTRYLSKKFEAPFIVNNANPWGDFYYVEVPKSGNKQINYDLTVPVDFSKWKALKVTNTSAHNLDLFVSSTKNSLIDLSFYLGSFVIATKSKRLDPLSHEGKEFRFNLLPGETQIVFLKLMGVHSGKGSIDMSIKSEKFSKNITIKFNIFKLKKVKPLNAINWAFLNKPMLKHRKQLAIEDLDNHHINTFVSPTHILGWIGSKTGNKLTDYFSEIDKSSNLVLYYNFDNHQIRSIKGNARFMSKEWKEQFVPWYRQRIDILVKMGFDPDRIYFYPFDEPSGEEVNDFIKFSKWAQKELPELNLFVTILKKDALKVKDYTDILVVSDRLPLAKIRKELPDSTWFYSILPRSRDRSPYLDYRLMAWKAYYYGFKGIGFWNYASFVSRTDNAIASQYLRGNKDYSVIYTEGDEIVSSRRWEAFSQGLEDYRIIIAYANRFGINPAKSLVHKVLKNKSNTYLASSVLEEMLRKLDIN